MRKALSLKYISRASCGRSASLQPGTRFLPAIVLVVIVGVAPTGCKSSRVASGTALIQAQQDTAGQAVTSTSNRPVSRLVCPAFSRSSVPSALPLRGGHRVILSWKASDSEDANHAAAVGYCVYRGTDRNRPPTELLNRFPFSGSKCADDLVENGKKYYYLVRAVSDKGATSLASAPARAAIPKGPQTSSEVSPDSTPLCREPGSVK
jgi:hypothetical protein